MNHTTQDDIMNEIKRQQARLLFITDETNRQILSASIVDLLKLHKAFPQTLWAVPPREPTN